MDSRANLYWPTGDEQAYLQENAVQLKSIKGNGFTGLGGILFYNLQQALQLGIV